MSEDARGGCRLWREGQTLQVRGDQLRAGDAALLLTRDQWLAAEAKRHVRGELVSMLHCGGSGRAALRCYSHRRRLCALSPTRRAKESVHRLDSEQVSSMTKWTRKRASMQLIRRPI